MSLARHNRFFILTLLAIAVLAVSLFSGAAATQAQSAEDTAPVGATPEPGAMAMAQQQSSPTSNAKPDAHSGAARRKQPQYAGLRLAGAWLLERRMGIPRQ